jgi:hypothetical protein
MHHVEEPPEEPQSPNPIPYCDEIVKHPLPQRFDRGDADHKPEDEERYDVSL